MRGFILQSSYRVEAGRSSIVLFGRSEDGGTFVVRDDRQKPCLFVAARDAQGAGEATAFHSLDGQPVVRITAAAPRDLASPADLATFEADVGFVERFLIARKLRGGIIIEGDPVRRGTVLHYLNPALSPSEYAPQLSLLSIDIETDAKAERLLSIALHGCGPDRVLLFTPAGYDCPPGAAPFANERALLQGFVDEVRERDPDVITGWNVVDFDFAVLVRIAERERVPLALGRAPGATRVRPARSFWASGRATIPGRVVLDGMALVRGAFVQMDEYSLDYVAREVLGEGKTVSGDDRVGEIVRMFKTERAAFVEYNLQDAKLAARIIDKLHLLELAVRRSLLTGMPIDRVNASIASFDSLYLGELWKRGVVAPSVRAQGDGIGNAGGLVLEPRTGLFDNVLVFDFRSLYPSLMRTFQLDPLSFHARPRPGDIIAPNGAAFAPEPSILAGILSELFTARDAAKAVHDEVGSHAIKILMNSLYGVLGAPTCRFYNPALANAITSFGRELLLYTKARCEVHGHEVLYGDTDSLFVRSNEADGARALSVGRTLAVTLNEELRTHITNTWPGAQSALLLQLEGLYDRLFFPRMRQAAGGARKRYVGRRDGATMFTGMEAVRSDWTSFAKEAQVELYTRLFAEQPVAEYLRELATQLRRGALDDKLVYRKAIRKPLSEYTASTPPHIAAALKLAVPPRRRIAYVMTINGPEPVEAQRSPLDHAHYLDKQLRAVAEPVLAHLGLDFDVLTDNVRQLSLF